MGVIDFSGDDLGDEGGGGGDDLGEEGFLGGEGGGGVEGEEGGWDVRG